jgi:hypothetical protein
MDSTMQKVISWVEYFIKWFLRAMPIPIRITEISLLLLGLIALAVHKYFPNWEITMNPLVWQIPLILLGVAFVGSLAWSSFMLYREKVQIISNLNTKINDLNMQLDAARKMAYPPVTTLMMTQYFKDLDIPLGDYGLVNREMEDKVFDHCRIRGPTVIAVQDCLIAHCEFEGDIDTTLIVTTNKSMFGVLGTNRCKFINCIFENVGIIANQETIDRIKQGFSNKQ